MIWKIEWLIRRQVWRTLHWWWMHTDSIYREVNKRTDSLYRKK